MLPRVIKSLIMEFHETNKFCEKEEYLKEFTELVAGKPRTILTMLWYQWWD
jgi:hypothetical protein